MGANVSCPQDFEQGVGVSCRLKCPQGFKYAQEGGGTSPLVEKCVFSTNNTYSIQLRQLPPIRRGQRQPREYAAERKRFSDELKALNQRIQTEGPVQDKIVSFKEQRSNDVNQYNRIQSQYANYSSGSEVAKKIKEVTDSLKPMRPPVAGSDEINLERRRILETSQPSMIVIQVALAVAVLCLLAYVFLPANSAHIVAFLFLSVGVAVGIFLKK
jgi:hypothetical protein